jgi:SAM-dependent methyltransferase
VSAARDGSPIELYALLPERGEGEIVASALPHGYSILELGCGAGQVTRQLVARGYRVTAVDESSEMLAHVHGAETVEARIEELELGRSFDAAVLASNLVNTESVCLRRAFLRSCARHAPLVLIERLPPEWEPSLEHRRLGEVDSWLEDVGRDGDVVRAVACYAAAGRRWRHPFAMRVLGDPALEAALAEAGLRLERFLDERRTWVAAARAA